METLNALTQMGQVPLGMTLEALKASGQVQQADQIGLQEMLRKQAQSQRMDPMLLQQQQLQNQGLERSNQVQDFNLRGLGRKDKMETELWDLTKATALQKLLAEQGADGAKIFGNKLYEQLQTTQPGTPQHRAIMGALATTREWVEKSRDDRTAATAAAATGARAKELMQMQIDAGRFKKTDKFGVSFEQRLGTFKKAHEQHQALVQAAMLADQEGNAPLAESYRARADAIRPQAEAELRMIQQPGKVDLSDPKFKIPTTPQGSIAPPNAQKPDPLGIR